MDSIKRMLTLTGRKGGLRRTEAKAIKILSYKNDVILDPFCGSGTSVVAAEILNRRWLGIELSPNYCEVARGRVQAFVDEKTKVKIELD